MNGPSAPTPGVVELRSEPQAYLLEWARLPGPRKVLDAARDRLERGRLGANATLDVTLTPAERREVGSMLPAGWTTAGTPVSVRALQHSLHDHEATLSDLLVAIGGPLRDLAGERRRRRDASALQRAEALGNLHRLLGVGVPTGLDASVAGVLERVILRGDQDGQLARDIEQVVAGLPTDADTSLAVLAASLFKDAHALDRSRRLGRAVARFLALRWGVQAAFGDALTSHELTRHELLAWSDPLESADAWRAAWSTGRVTCDAVSSQVLVLNLPLTGDAPAARLCAAAPGEPTWITLRSLVGEFTLDGPHTVFVCENPSVVEAAAAALGADCPALVCTFGRPSSAAWALLRGIAPRARLHVRADGDSVGRQIVETILREFPEAVRWRMSDASDAFEEEIVADLLTDLTQAAERARQR